jgi:hypothetical protein
MFYDRFDAPRRDGVSEPRTKSRPIPHYSFLGVQSLLKLYRDDTKLTWNGKMMKGVQEVSNPEFSLI